MKRPATLHVLSAAVAFILLVSVAGGVIMLRGIPHWGAAEQSPLHSAVLADNLARVKTLLPKAPAGAADEQLFYARSSAMAELLLSSGASVNARAHGSSTPLHFAAALGVEEVVAVLLRHGAEVNAVDDGKRTPLMSAVTFGMDPDLGFESAGFEKTEARRLAVTQLLLKSGARVDQRDSGGTTALGHATTAGHSKEITELLVNAGADVNSRSVDNITPLHGAAFSRDLQTIRFLVEHGADVTIKDWQGKRPIDFIEGTNPEAEEIRKLFTK